jgi:hypothetical protein
MIRIQDQPSREMEIHTRTLLEMKNWKDLWVNCTQRMIFKKALGILEKRVQEEKERSKAG